MRRVPVCSRAKRVGAKYVSLSHLPQAAKRGRAGGTEVVNAPRKEEPDALSRPRRRPNDDLSVSTAGRGRTALKHSITNF